MGDVVQWASWHRSGRRSDIGTGDEAACDFLDAVQRLPTGAVNAALDAAYRSRRTAYQRRECVESQVMSLSIFSERHAVDLTPAVSRTQPPFSRGGMDGALALADHLAMNRKPTKSNHLYIREWREFREVTQEVLADKVGMSAANLSRIERGLQGYTRDNLETIAKALRCEPADLLANDPSDESVKLMDRLRRMSDAKLRDATRLLDVLDQAEA